MTMTNNQTTKEKAIETVGTTSYRWLDINLSKLSDSELEVHGNLLDAWTYSIPQEETYQLEKLKEKYNQEKEQRQKILA